MTKLAYSTRSVAAFLRLRGPRAKLRRFSSLSSSSSLSRLRLVAVTAGAFCCYGVTTFLSSSRMAVIVQPPTLKIYEKVAAADEESAPPDARIMQLDRRQGIVSVVLFGFYDFFNFVSRGIWLFGCFGPVMLSYPLMIYFLESYEGMWWKWYFQSVSVSGPTVVKLYQWAATRRDIFSQQFCEIFSHLHTRATPHSWEETRNILNRVMPEWKSHLIVDLDDDDDDDDEKNSYCSPIGSGCIGQVYKAKLRIDGTPVAVKVLHPGIHQKIKNDLKWIQCVAFIADTIIPGAHWLSLREHVREFERLMEKQLDLRVEARNLRAFRKNFKINDRDDATSVYFPKPISKFCSTDVLVETYEHGLTLAECLSHIRRRRIKPNLHNDGRSAINEGDEVCKNNKDGRVFHDLYMSSSSSSPTTSSSSSSSSLSPLMASSCMGEEERNLIISSFLSQDNRKYIAQVGCSTFIKMLFEDNFTHGDLHPGNILISFPPPTTTTTTPTTLSSNHHRPTWLLLLLDKITSFASGTLSSASSSSSSSSSSPLRAAVARAALWFNNNQNTDDDDDESIKRLHDHPQATPPPPHHHHHHHPRLTFLDAGIVTELSRDDWTNFIDVFRAVVQRQGYKVGQLILERSPHQECKDPDLYAREMDKLVQRAYQTNIQLSKLQVGILLTEVLDLSRRHHVKLDSAFTSTILAVVIIEGIGRSLDPDLDILQIACKALMRL